MKPKPRRPLPPATRQRLVAAAARVFARDGLSRATTREIAREAGVNEVTLFRHFQSKDRLIAAVVGENFGPASLSRQDTDPAATDNLRQDLTRHAERYEALLAENLPLIRTMIGEIRHHSSHERQVFKAILRPLRAALIARLQSARQAGELRRGDRPEILADLFSAMIFTGVLRRATPHVVLEYSSASYLAAAVDLIAPAGAGGTSS